MGWVPAMVVGAVVMLVLLGVIGALASPGNGSKQLAGASGATGTPTLSTHHAAPGGGSSSPAPAHSTRPTPTHAPTSTHPPTHGPTPTHAPKPTHAPTPKPPIGPLCGAPANPWGYNFCGRGGAIYSSDLHSTVCGYFDCIPNFPNGVGYMVECNDGTYSMSGGRQGACSHHSGEWREVYRGP